MTANKVMGLIAWMFMAFCMFVLWLGGDDVDRILWLGLLCLNATSCLHAEIREVKR